MMQTSNRELLQAYARTRDEAAFGALVARYINLVHAAALRQTRDSHLADDVTQAVFIILARRAGGIGDAANIAGWLINTTRYAAMSALKLRSRRRIHETRAAAMTSLVDRSSSGLQPPAQLDAVLDEALSRLGVTDRSAIALRYLQGKRVDEVGAALGISTDAAQKRILRALEKLRGIFARRGITAPADALALGIAAHAAHHAPIELAAIVTGQAAPAASAIANGVITTTIAAQAKVVAACVAAALLIAGGAAAVVTKGQTSAHGAAATAPPAAVAPPTPFAAPATAPAGAAVSYPNHTFFQNNNPDFTVGIDDNTKRSGDPAVTIVSQTLKWGTNGTALRGFDSAPFRGKRVRFSAWVKSQNLANWGGLCLMVFGPEKRVLATDDMGPRPMVGTNDWMKLEIVADIPSEAMVMHGGLHMYGAGQIWMDGAQIEVVPETVPITDDQIWHAWSFSRPKYTVGLDPNTRRNGKPTLLISATKPGVGEWCAWDHIDRHPQKYLGKRMKMSCWIKTENVTANSGLRIRSQGPLWQFLDDDPAKHKRTIKGTTPWTKYELIVDIPDDAFSVVSGIRMGGRGKLWVDDFQYEVLEPDK